MINADTINAAYKNLSAAQVEVHNATTGVLEAKEKLSARRAEFLEMGEIDGKNAETREAQLKTRTEPEAHRVAAAEGMAREAELRLRCAGLEVERCKTLLKLMEVTRP